MLKNVSRAILLSLSMTEKAEERLLFPGCQPKISFHFSRILAASSALGSTDWGKLSFHANGLHAVMIPLDISLVPSLLASGDSMGLDVPLRQFFTMSIELSRSTRVPRAQSTCDMLDGSISSSTTITNLFWKLVALETADRSPACLAWPGWPCLMETTMILWSAPSSMTQTPLTSGTWRSSSFQRYAAFWMCLPTDQIEG